VILVFFFFFFFFLLRYYLSLTDRFTQECIDVGAREGQEGATEDAWKIVKILPETNRRVVNYMINFLRVRKFEKKKRK